MVSQPAESNTTQTFDVKAFGALGDGQTDDTDALMSAAQAATQAGGGTIYLPAGEYCMRFFRAAKFDGVLVTQGCELVGDGPDRTVIRGIAEVADANWNTARLIIVQSGTRVAGITFNGVRDEFNRNTFKNYAAILLRTERGASDILVEDCHFHGQYGNGSREGFGLSIAESHAVALRRIEAYDNDGSGISIDGNFDGQRSHDVTVDDIRVYRNGWQGIAVHVAERVVVTRASAYENVRHGLNIEWSNDVTYRDCEAWDNGRRGLRVSGDSRGILWDNVRSRNNGAQFTTGAELILELREFRLPNREIKNGGRGYPKDVAFKNVTLEPAEGNPQVLLALGDDGEDRASALAGAGSPRTAANASIPASPLADSFPEFFQGASFDGTDTTGMNIQTGMSSGRKRRDGAPGSKAQGGRRQQGANASGNATQTPDANGSRRRGPKQSTPRKRQQPRPAAGSTSIGKQIQRKIGRLLRGS